MPAAQPGCETFAQRPPASGGVTPAGNCPIWSVTCIYADMVQQQALESRAALGLLDRNETALALDSCQDSLCILCSPVPTCKAVVGVWLHREHPCDVAACRCSNKPSEGKAWNKCQGTLLAGSATRGLLASHISAQPSWRWAPNTTASPSEEQYQETDVFLLLAQQAIR